MYVYEKCHLQLKKRRFTCLSSKFYYKSGQCSAAFITVVRVHKPSSCPTDYTFCFSYRFLGLGIVSISGSGCCFNVIYAKVNGGWL